MVADEEGFVPAAFPSGYPGYQQQESEINCDNPQYNASAHALDLIALFQLGSFKIMRQDLPVIIAFTCHHGCSYLAEADTMSPTGSG